MSNHFPIAKFIEEQRNALDLTRDELADIAGVDKKWIADIETDADDYEVVENFLRLVAVFGALQNERQPENINWAHLPQLSTIFSQLLMLDSISIQMFITLFPEYRRIALRLRDA